MTFTKEVSLHEDIISLIYEHEAVLTMGDFVHTHAHTHTRQEVVFI